MQHRDETKFREISATHIFSVIQFFCYATVNERLHSFLFSLLPGAKPILMLAISHAASVRTTIKLVENETKPYFSNN
jgi:hypothetical protein